jgi:transposase
MEAYSMDLRKRVLAACDSGKGTLEVSRVFAVSPAWIRRLKQRRREWGIVHALPKNSGRKPKLTLADQKRLTELVAQTPDATLEELRDQLGVQVDPTTICRALKKLDLTFKKSPSMPPSRTGRT